MTAIDMSSPLIQQLLQTSPGLVASLGLSPAPAAAPPAPPAPALTADMVRQIVDERLAATPPAAPALQRLQGVSAQFEAVFQQALAPEDYKAFQGYVAAGSPGFAEMLAGDKLHPIAQLLWETIKENKA